MRPIISIVGILLIIVGIAALGYQGFTYTKHEKIAQIGDVQLTADTEKRVNLPPILGGLSFVAGIILVVVARRSK
jgi:hypothetical protein